MAPDDPLSRLFNHLGFGDDNASGDDCARPFSPSDEDIDSAEAELDDFLSSGSGKTAAEDRRERETRARETRARETRARETRARTNETIPPGIVADYQRFSLPPGSDLHTVKAAWKALLKERHPDRHGKDTQELHAAHRDTAELNAAMERIEAWLEKRGT